MYIVIYLKIYKSSHTNKKNLYVFIIYTYTYILYKYYIYLGIYLIK